MGKIFICPPLFNCPKSCLPPGSDDGNTIEEIILYGWAWGVAGTTQNDYVYVESCDTIRYAKYYPDKAVGRFPVIMPSITAKNVEWDCWSG